ncbi:MAG: tRNA pseudouridine(38-40) synthase TruA [Acetobacterales bacterium]
MKYKLTIEYDGTPFVGWQRQANGPSVQQALEDAVTAFCGESATVMGAGRTDAGVHALAQVADLTLSREHPAETVMNAVNFHLKPAPVSVLSVETVADDFQARFSAVERQYLYRILNRRTPPALERNRVWFLPRLLDTAAMHEAAQGLVGRHDFTSFRAAHCQATSPEKTLDAVTVERHEEEIQVGARARSFLHHQVRNIVGTLALVGEGKWSVEDVSAALAARDRSAAGPTAPACGLYLVAVRY